jgi:DNA-binding transcriptional LysR family regulator
LSAAARRLRLTQPTLGRHIDELERDLGVALFTRSQSGLTPTAAALELQPYAEAMAGAAEALVRAASAEADEERGSVRITASEIVATEVLPRLLTAFRRAHPGIAIEIVASNRNEDLLRRTADIAVRMVRPSQTALVARRIGAVGLGLHAHRRYVEVFGTPSSLRELDRHTVIGFDQETVAVQILQKLGLTLDRESFGLRTDSDLMQLAAIRAGYGIGVCQTGIARRDPDLVRLLPGEFAFDLECWLAMHEDLRSVGRVRLVYDHLAAGLADYVAGREKAVATD